jgi:hypothetical protein
MRSRPLFVCLSAIAIAWMAKTQSASFLHLNRGGLSNLPETEIRLTGVRTSTAAAARLMPAEAD